MHLRREYFITGTHGLTYCSCIEPDEHLKGHNLILSPAGGMFHCHMDTGPTVSVSVNLGPATKIWFFVAFEDLAEVRVRQRMLLLIAVLLYSLRERVSIWFLKGTSLGFPRTPRCMGLHRGTRTLSTRLCLPGLV